MRFIPIIVLSLALSACASAPSIEPREFLDEGTAATITVVAEPWIFSRERTNTTADQRDFLNVYAIDVNRMGEHKQYLAVLQSSRLIDDRGVETPPPTLQLRTGGEVIALQPTDAEPRTLGISQPVAEAYTAASIWWYYPIDKDTLARVIRAEDVQASLAAGEVRAPYVLWRDGRAEAEALAAAIP